VTINDTFNRADSTTTLGTTSDGTATWSALRGTWGINTNQAYSSVPVPSSENVAVLDLGSADGTIQVTLAAINASGIAFRVQDANNFLICRPAGGPGQLYTVYKYIAGSYTVVASGLGVAAANGDVLKVVMSGTTVTAYQNGTQIYTGTITNFSTQTQHGLNMGTNSTATRWDNFSFTPPASVAASLTAGRTARSFTLTGFPGRSAALTAARTARAFTASGTTSQAVSPVAPRTARGFTLAADANYDTSAGRPDAGVGTAYGYGPYGGGAYGEVVTPVGWGRLDRDFSLTVDVDPAIDPPPATRPPTFYRRASYSVTAPTTAADGWSNPKQTRTLIDGSVVGRHRFRFDGLDRTFYRGVPMRLVEDSHANPFGPEIAVFHFPQVSPFEAPPSWLDDGAKVVTTLVDGSGITVPGWAWIGHVHNRTPELAQDSWGTTVEAKGFLYQSDDATNKPLPTQQGGAAVPIGYRVAQALNHVIGKRYPGITWVDTTPAITRSRGSLSQTVMAFVRDLLGTAWTSTSQQWTVLDVAGAMKAQIVLPDPSVVDLTLSAGQDGVTFDLHEEQDEQPNVVYGEWIDPAGGRHQRLKFPRLHEDRAPAYPLPVGSVFNPGAGTTGFQAFSDWMRRNGFSSFDSQDTYLASDEDDVKAAQTRMGATSDGIVGAQTWGTAFNTGADVGDLRNAIYLPIAWDPRVEPYLYAPDGAKISKNPAYDATVRRKETYVNFGEGLTYREVRRSAQQIVTRNTTGTSLVGQIEVKGTDFEEMSKLVARAGTTLRVRYLYGTGSAGVKFHLARIHRAYGDDGTVTATLDVDTKWRDAYTVAQIIERNKAAKADPARLLRRQQTSGLTQDTKLQFDADDIGRIYRHNVQGGFWRIVEFPAASWGTWVRVTAVTSPATEFALMLFSKEITPRDLDTLVGNPLSSSHPYNPQATALEAAGLIQAWGSADQPAGYSQTNAADGYKSDGAALTGRLEYDSGVDFAPANGASLFLAEWCAASTVIHETFELQPVSL
jgi:hypothetical protein